jgi:glycosyltransferase involved in cell wall biosynthesis
MISPYPAAGLDAVGGVEMSTFRLAEALAEQSVDVKVIAPGAPGAAPPGSVTVIRVRADQRWLLARALRPWRTAVRTLIGDLEADVVHGQGLLWGGLPATDGARSRTAHGLCVRRVVTAHGNVHEDMIAARSGLGASTRALLGRRLCGLAAGRADVLVGPHPDWRVNVPRLPRRFVHIPNIVDDLFFQALRRPESGRVLYCGGPGFIKGWDILLRSWPLVVERVPEARLEALGFPAGYELLGTDGAAGSIDLRRWVSVKETRDAMERATVLVIPSRFEVAPTVLAEAWAACVPVLATAVGGTPTLAAGAAQLVPAGDPTALAAAIIDVLRGVRPVGHLVEAGSSRARVHRRERVADAHLRLYANLDSA